MASYQYKSDREYWLSYYEEQIAFARSKVQSHLKAAMSRKQEQEFELKLYCGILLGIFVLCPLGILLTMSGGLLMLVGGTILVALSFGIVFVVPVCCYKISKGLFYWIINRSERAEQWLMQRFGIQTVQKEIQVCMVWIEKYRLLEEQIQKWRGEIDRQEAGTDEKGPDKEEMESRFEHVNFEPCIEVVSEFRGGIRKLARIAAIAGGLVLYLFLAMAGMQVVETVQETIVSLMRQL